MAKKLALGLVIVVLALYGFGFTQKTEIRTAMDIAAPVEPVWSVLSDFDAYPDWNPFIIRVDGQPVAGTTLEAIIQPLHTGKAQTFRPTVLVARENEELRWRGRLLIPGLFDGEHYFLIEETESGTRFVHGEKFRGLLLLAFDMTDFIPSFEALKAEAGIRSRGRPAKSVWPRS